MKPRINLLWVGRLSKEKGCKDLVYSAKYLDFKANVFILGDGEEFNEIKNDKKQIFKNLILGLWFLENLNNNNPLNEGYYLID